MNELQELNISDIEHELHKLHRNAHPGKEIAYPGNLVYAIWDFDDGGESLHLSARLAGAQNARAILLRVNDKPGSSPRAWISVEHDETELIILEVNGGDPVSVAPLLSQISSSGHHILIWDNSLSYSHPLLRELSVGMDRVIVSIIPPCDEMAALKPFLSVCDTLGSKPYVTDLAESMLAAWQTHISGFFTSDPQLMSHIREIRMLGEEQKPSAEFLLLAAWMSCVLNWKPAEIERAGESFILHFNEDKRVVLEPNSDRRNRIEFRVVSVDGERTIACDEPESEIRVAELMLMQLQIRNRDPIREESLRRLRAWILFADS
ncbi:hypothetical protein EHM69_06325 [candidate division KSB1 bacterium]|nr:MAG: hypothetical protein EHM69_06325 [candidate division KSB1 bacterium]